MLEKLDFAAASAYSENNLQSSPQPKFRSRIQIVFCFTIADFRFCGTERYAWSAYLDAGRFSQIL